MPKDLLMPVSIGNTNITFGVYGAQGEFIARDKIPTRQAEQFFKAWKKQKALKRLASDRIVSSVGRVLTVSTRPPAERLVGHWSREVFGLKPLKAGKDFTIPMPIKVDEPERVGADRLVDAVAAYQRTKRLTLVIDFGTAITFNVVSDKGEFLGGAIAAGPGTMARGLHNDCVLLPLIEPAAVTKAIGKNTREALQAGVYLGSVGLTKYLIETISAELGAKPAVIATGGDAELIQSHLPLIDEVVPDLTLQGLLLSYQHTH